MKRRIIVLIIVISVTMLVLGMLCYDYAKRLTISTNTISLGVEFNAHATPFYILLEKGSLRENGINVTNLLLFRTGMELAAAVARGDIVAGQACLGPIIMMMDKGIPVKIIGKIHNGGFALVVDPDKIKDLKDLNGQVVYTLGPGTQTHFLALKIQDKYNVSFSEIKSLPPQEILAGLIKRSIVAAILPKPYPEVAESLGLKILIESNDVWPNMPGSYIFVVEEYYEKNPDVIKQIVRLIENEIQVIRKNISYATKIVAKWLGISEVIATKAIQSIEWSTEIDIQQIQEYIDFAYSKGVIKKRYDANTLVIKV